MTKWQWSVIIALCKTVLNWIPRSSIRSADLKILHEAIDRDRADMWKDESE